MLVKKTMKLHFFQRQIFVPDFFFIYLLKRSKLAFFPVNTAPICWSADIYVQVFKYLLTETN